MKYLIVLLGLGLMISCGEEDEQEILLGGSPSTCNYNGRIMSYFEEEGSPILEGERVIDACTPLRDAQIRFYKEVEKSDGLFSYTEHKLSGTATSDSDGFFSIKKVCDLVWGHETFHTGYQHSNISKEYVLSPNEDFQIFEFDRSKIAFYFILDNEEFDQELLNYEISLENGNALPFVDRSLNLFSPHNRPLPLNTDNTFETFKLSTELLKNINLKLVYSYNSQPRDTFYFYTNEDVSHNIIL